MRKFKQNVIFAINKKLSIPLVFISVDVRFHKLPTGDPTYETIVKWGVIGACHFQKPMTLLIIVSNGFAEFRQLEMQPAEATGAHHRPRGGGEEVRAGGTRTQPTTWQNSQRDDGGAVSVFIKFFPIRPFL